MSTDPVEARATSTTTPPTVIDEIVAFNRIGADGVERYFTARTDGSDQQSLFSAEGCMCIGWSPDGSELWTVSMSEVGTVSFTTMNSDGGDRTVHVPPIATLNIGPGAATLEGRIAFNGWDESNPANTGVWIGSRDLSDIEHVVTLPEGVVATEPMGFVGWIANSVLRRGRSTRLRDHAGDLFVSMLMEPAFESSTQTISRWQW